MAKEKGREEIVQHVLRDELELLDPKVPEFLKLLSKRGADICWHKHSTFKQHLYQVWKILTIWKQPQHISRCGLFHSAYSNSFVNLAIFNANESRDMLKDMLGVKAEEWVYLFCTINRQEVIFDIILKQNKVPESATVKHIKNGTDVVLTKEVMGTMLVMTMADYCDQLFSWQDKLFQNEDGKLLYNGNNPGTLWPGDGKPGLWMSCLSRMGQLAYQAAQTCEKGGVILPEVFDHCQKFLSEDNERKARDLYWDVICNNTEPKDHGDAEKKLIEAVACNPFVAEPHALLAQIYNTLEKYDDALYHAKIAMELLEQWGTAWDKRMQWEGWIAWVRQLLLKAQDKSWPQGAWGIINLGLAK